MAKLFYNAAEAAERLGKTEEEIKALVREGKLREFRDAGSVNYKVEDVDALAGKVKEEKKPPPEPAEPSAASASGEIVLEPADDSSIEVSPGLTDVISLEESETDDAESSGTTTVARSKEDTVVPSVGVNVFDDDEIDEQVDPLAQTAVTDLAGLGLEGSGSGSGILELTRESDDTSLGKELLDELHTGEEAEAEAPVEMGEGTRAGLEAVPEADEEPQLEPQVAAVPQPRAAQAVAAEYAPDAVGSALTALMVVGVAVLGVAGLATAALTRGVSPPLIEAIYARLWVFAVGSVLLGGVAAAVTWFVARRSGG